MRKLALLLATAAAMSLIASAMAKEDSDIATKVQQFLADRMCDPGVVDGQWGARSEKALALFQRLTGLKVDRPFTPVAMLDLAGSKVKCTDAADVLPVRPPAFTSGDLMIGQTWRSHLETGQRVGRVTIETDPAYVRSGATSLRLHLVPDDCGGDVEYNAAPWNDCTSPQTPNERVAVLSEPSAEFGKTYWYGASLFLKGPGFRRSPKVDPEHKEWLQVNLYQWIADQPMYDVVWFSNEPENLSLKIRTQNCEPCEFHIIADNALDRWVDIVTHVKWSKKGDGFMNIWVDGKKAYETKGPTLYPQLNLGQMGQQIQLYRYSGVGQGYPPLTAWFDQLVQSRSLDALAPYFDITDEMRAEP